MNLFEFPDNEEEPFLVKALQSGGDLTRLVVEHIRQDQRLTERASEYLAIYSDLSNLFKEFKDHLDGYGTHLVKKDNPPILLSLAKQILSTWRKILNLGSSSGTRGRECAQIYVKLDKSLQIISKTAKEDSYNSFDEVHKIMLKMREDSMQALGGFSNAAQLHEEILKLIYKFEIQLLVSKKEINHGKDEVINHLKENHKREKFELEKENTELRAKQTLMEAKQDEMEATIRELLQQMASGHSHPSEEKPDSQDQIRETRGFFRP